MLKDLLSLLSPLCQLVLGELVILPFSFWVTKQFLFLKKINNLSCARNNQSKAWQKWSSLAFNLRNLRLLSSLVKLYLTGVISISESDHIQDTENVQLMISYFSQIIK